MKLKGQGVLPGIPDLCLPVARRGYHGLYIEMKSGKGKLSPIQLEIQLLLIKEGYASVVANGWEKAKTIIERYLS